MDGEFRSCGHGADRPPVASPCLKRPRRARTAEAEDARRLQERSDAVLVAFGAFSLHTPFTYTCLKRAVRGERDSGAMRCGA